MCHAFVYIIELLYLILLIVLLLQVSKNTALHRAADNGHLKIVEILLSEGAEVDSRDIVSTCNNVMSLGYKTY